MTVDIAFIAQTLEQCRPERYHYSDDSDGMTRYGLELEQWAKVREAFAAALSDKFPGFGAGAFRVETGDAPVMPELEPYYVTEWCASSVECDYCDDGADIAESHRHLLYVTREGASSRTADDLAQTFLFDVAEIVTAYDVPAELAALEFSYPMNAWCEDPDDAQALADECLTAESALGDVGLYVTWSDGYVIERVELASETLELEQSGAEQ